MLVDLQISLEKTENTRLQDSLNMSYFLANEYAANKFKYKDSEHLIQSLKKRDDLIKEEVAQDIANHSIRESQKTISK